MAGSESGLPAAGTLDPQREAGAGPPPFAGRTCAAIRTGRPPPSPIAAILQRLDLRGGGAGRVPVARDPPVFAMHTACDPTETAWRHAR